MDLMMMVGEMTLILLAEVVAVSHGNLEAVRSTYSKLHQFRIQIQVGNKTSNVRYVCNTIT
jgi:hypothetical protein